MNNRRLTKSTSNVVISGTLGGIAEYIGIDPTIFRLIFAICTPVSGMSLAIIYFVLMFIIPSGTGGKNTRSGNRRYYDGNRGYGGNPYSRNAANKHSRKEAEKVEDEDDWSDF